VASQPFDTPPPPARPLSPQTNSGPKQYAKGKLSYRGSTIIRVAEGTTAVTDQQFQGGRRAPPGAGAGAGPACSCAAGQQQQQQQQQQPWFVLLGLRHACCGSHRGAPCRPADIINDHINRRKLPFDAANGMFLIMTR
jgi:hypothetical protein